MLTEEQVKARKSLIGGSDAAAILGLSRWETPLSVWSEKTGAIPTEDKSGILAIEVGNELENLVCKLFEKRTGKKTRRVNDYRIHPQYSFIGCQIDRRVVGEDAILEAKTASWRKAEEWKDDEIPQEYLVQVMQQLLVTGAAHAYIAVLIGGNQNFLWKKVERDETLIKTILDREVEFWTKFVEPRVMPQLVMADDTKTLGKLFPSGVENPTIELGKSGEEIIAGIDRLAVQIKALEDAIETEKNRLRLMLGEHAIATAGPRKVTWKNQETTRLDTKKFKESQPDLFARYAKTTHSRVLRIS